MPAPEMPALRSRHLMTLLLRIDYGAIVNIGKTATGRRRIAPVAGGVFEGKRLSGVVLPGGADWVLMRPDDDFTIDVRLILQTQDEALIYLSYQGLFKTSPENHERMRRRERLPPEEYSIRTVARFETGAPGLAWLNDCLAIGVGTQSEAGAVYEVFEVV
jgi:hypothetical protein